MNRSYFHNTFASILSRNHAINKQDVLDYPENYLGPNYKGVLNYWIYLVYLSHEQWDRYLDKRNKLDREALNKAYDLAENLASEVIDARFVDRLNYEVREIVAAHLYIERNIPFTFLPLIIDL